MTNRIGLLLVLGAAMVSGCAPEPSNAAKLKEEKDKMTAPTDLEKIPADVRAMLPVSGDGKGK